jgi:murein DD-endopeptidase MepM/ murein hydrolase activator NlpD
MKVATPAERRLEGDIRKLELGFKKLNSHVDELTLRMVSIDKRVDHVYQAALGVGLPNGSPQSGDQGLSIPIIDVPGTCVINSDFMEALYVKVDLLRRKISLDSISECNLILLAEDRQRVFAGIPAIQPVSKLSLSTIASGFGMRMHPFEHVIKMHLGMDFAAPEGTPIYATADGEVIAADSTFIGYGTMVIVDHGLGYQTRYAHLQEFIVAPGDRVVRGQRIAYVGNTGHSTAPHLHYEVLLNGVQINPIHYFLHDLTPPEYATAFRLAAIQNQSMGN